MNSHAAIPTLNLSGWPRIRAGSAVRRAESCLPAWNRLPPTTARGCLGLWYWLLLALLALSMAKAQAETKPADDGSLLVRAVAAYRLEDDELAVALFSQAINHGSREAYEGRARAFYRMGDYNQALADINQCLRDHVTPDLIVLRGRMELATGDYNQAAGDFSLVIKDQPANAELLAALGDCYLYSGQPRLALRDYRHALRLGYTNAMLFAHCGELEAGWSHEYRQGLKDCLTAVRLDKNCWLAYNNLAAILASSKSAQFRDGQLACINARKACDLTHWTNPLPLAVYASACAEIHDFADAIRWQQQAINLELSMGDAGIHQALNDEKKLQLYLNKKPFHAS